eukprot:gb/GFBE01066413.1/.p1 GENE.gb/GFBE01066413.1/~~gb/GFBE01066413.1/.p1  ORF type:complete len:114 (+),score=9.53 gb/GFBE01066413.1/:1-342(+)
MTWTDDDFVEEAASRLTSPPANFKSHYRVIINTGFCAAQQQLPVIPFSASAIPSVDAGPAPVVKKAGRMSGFVYRRRQQEDPGEDLSPEDSLDTRLWKKTTNNIFYHELRQSS